MLAVQNHVGSRLQQCCHQFHQLFHLFHQKSNRIHHQEGPQGLGTRSQTIWAVGRGVGEVLVAFRVVG
jgi:hypothetical protein